jgi:hypothetical protein
VHGPDAAACPHGVDDHRLGAAFEVGKRVEARRAAVERRHTPGKATTFV